MTIAWRTETPFQLAGQWVVVVVRVQTSPVAAGSWMHFVGRRDVMAVLMRTPTGWVCRPVDDSLLASETPLDDVFDAVPTLRETLATL